MNGVILVDKPKGWTSFDVVAKIRGLIKQKTGLKRPKVGHAGTLDPLATGLLIVLVGDECKNQDKYMKLDKTYEVELKLGETSSTDDAEGDIIPTKFDQRLTKMVRSDTFCLEVHKVICSFVGEIKQTPPIYSAIKIGGKRAYKLAREGSKPAMKPRLVTLHSIINIEYKYPYVSFTTSVSSGTYIRSLVRDIGEKLGTGAYMTNLRRSRINKYTLAQSINIENIELNTVLVNPDSK